MIQGITILKISTTYYRTRPKKDGYIYTGTDGFEELPQSIPKWIQTIFIYYGAGQINDSELINAIQYLAENGIIQVN